MADIQQAAKWMVEGKRVERSSERPLNMAMRVIGPRLPAVHDDDSEALIYIDDLLADDWEIAE